MKVGDLVRQRFNGRWDDVGLVLGIKHGRIPCHKMVTILWCTDQKEREDRQYRMRDLEMINESR